MVDLPLSDNRRMKVDEFDSGKMLANAAKQAKMRGYDKFPIVTSTLTITSSSPSTRSSSTWTTLSSSSSPRWRTPATPKASV